ARFTAIASAEEGDPEIEAAEKPRDELDAGRLAGAARGQVADADDGHARLVDRFPAMIERPVSRADAEPIAEAQGPQPRALERRQDAGAVAADQCVKGVVQGAIVHTFKERSYSRKAKVVSTAVCRHNIPISAARGARNRQASSA